MKISSNATRRLLALTMALLAGLAVVGSPRAEDPGLIVTIPTDFALISRNGFSFHWNNLGVDPVTGEPILGPDPLGSKMNSDSWSMKFWDPPGPLTPAALFVGPNRNAGCYTDTDSPEIVGTCPTLNAQGIPTLDDNDRAEIWKCTPSGANPIDGTCSRIYQSPVMLLGGLPWFLGFRKATACDAGGPDRLYFSGFGPRARIVYTANGSTVQVASISGLNTTLLNGAIGYNRSECFNGALWISETGTTTDNDIAPPGRAIPLANFNPANTSSPWRATAASGFGNPNNISLFNFRAFNGFLYAGVFNRVTGTEIWKTNGAGCAAPPAPCNSAGAGIWTQILKDGAGRPGGPAADGTPLNEGLAFMHVYDNKLYIGIGHVSSGQNPPRMEMMAFNPDDTWRLIVGKIRDAVAMAASFPNFLCNHIPDGVGGSMTPDPAKCFPEANMAPGFGGPTGPAPAYAQTDGDGSYFWSAEVYPIAPPNCLNVATLDRGQGNTAFGPRGADLYQTCDGTTFTAVTEDAFGLGDGASGIRNLAASPPPDNALYVGTSSRDTNTPLGGTFIFKGTCAPNGPLVADAGVVTQSTAPGRVVFDGQRYIVYDDEAVPNNMVTFTLDGSDSANRYCGHPITEYQWHSGNQTASCGALTILDLTFVASTAQHTVIDSPAGDPNIDVQYTLQVKAMDSSPISVEVSVCAIVDVRKSQNLPPKATITSTVPVSLQATGDRKTIDLPDNDGNGVESVVINGTCEETEAGDGVASCVFSNPLPGVTFSNTLCDAVPAAAPVVINCSTTATVAASRGLDVLLTATDNNGNTHVYTLNVEVREPRHDVEVRVVCPGSLVALPTSSIACTPAAATEDVSQTVRVRLRNSGDFPETFNVALSDSAPAGITLLSGQPVVNLATCLNLSSASCANTNVADVTFTWTPTEGGSHTLTATATLAGGVVDTDPADNTKSSLPIAVTGVNDNPPNAVDDTASTPAGTAVVKNVLANDTNAEGDGLILTSPTVSTATTQNGSVICTAAGSCTYTPPPAGFTGTDTFPYTLCDNGAPQICDTPATVTVTVTVIPPTPPTNVTAAPNGPLQARVSWLDGSNETRYEVRRCRVFFSLCIGLTTLTTTHPADSLFFDNVVPAAGAYRYSVRGCNTTCTAWVPTPGALVTVP